MNQLYHIVSWTPTEGMGGAGFAIELSKEWKELVSRYEFTSEVCKNMNQKYKELWLSAYGFNPELYEFSRIGVVHDTEWGIRSIQVPGSACGLDLISSAFCGFKDGMSLVPHNVDVLKQSGMILSMFLTVSDFLISSYRYEEIQKTKL